MSRAKGLRVLTTYILLAAFFYGLAFLVTSLVIR
jgi:hypothetical protein